MSDRTGLRIGRACIVSAAAALIVRIPNVPQPVGPDQGVFSVIGRGILAGKVPYRDLWDMASPGIFFVYAALFRLFGETMRAIALGDMLASITTAILVCLIAVRLASARPAMTGLLAGCAFAIFSAGGCFGMNSAGVLTAGSYWFLSQRETFIDPLAAAAFLIGVSSLAQGHDSYWRAILRAAAIGVMAGCAIVLRPPALLLFLPTIGVLCWTLAWIESRSGRVRGGVRALLLPLLFGLSATIPVAATLLWFWHAGGLAPMLEANRDYVSQIFTRHDHGLTSTMKNGFLRTALIVRENFMLWVLAASAGTCALTRKRRGDRTAELSAVVLVGAWAMTAVFSVLFYGEFFGYHYLLVVPPLSILAAWAVTASFPSGEPVMTQGKGTFALVLALALAGNATIFAALNYRNVTRFAKYELGSKSKDWYEAQFTAWPDHEYSYPADLEVVKYLEETTRPEDAVFVLGGIEAEIFFLSKRPPASRFIHSWYLTGTSVADIPLADRYRDEVAAMFRDSPPEVVVTIGPLERFTKTPSVISRISTLYRLDRSFSDGRFVYRLKSGKIPS